MNKSAMPSPQEREAALFALAIEKPVAERAAFLLAVCGADVALRQRLEALLAAHEQPETLLTPQADAIPPTIKFDLPEVPDEAVGQTLGRCKLLERVGEGGCGVVYVAEQTEPVRRRVALKVIKLGMDTKQVVARFEAERQALAMMDHPNIAKVLDAGTTETGRPFFVMELVRGIKITDYCDQANLSTKDRLDLFIKVCQAIQHAHQKGIIHRDIKPSNILVTLHDGVPVPKVIDFGIAKATEGRLTDATVYTQLHQFIGTPAYMSPEQAEMSGLDIDTRSDIYSLGVLLYELLAGSTPFDGKELMASGLDAMRKTIREKEPPRPSTRLATLGADQLTTTAKRRSADTSKLLHQLKGDLDWIVMKCLEKDRQRRYDTANGLAADLKRHLDNEPVVARPPSQLYRLQKAFRRNRIAFVAASAVLVSLIAALIGISASARREHLARVDESTQKKLAEERRLESEEARKSADAQARRAVESEQRSRRLLYASDMRLAQQSLKFNNVGNARLLLDRHRPQAGEEDLRGWEWRYLWQLTRSGALTTLTNRPSRCWSASFSDDGKYLATGWLDGRIEIWDPVRRTLLHGMFQSPADLELPGIVAFSPRSHLLAATDGKRNVVLYDVDSGKQTVLWSHEYTVRDLSFSPDGSLLVIYKVFGASDEVVLVDTATREIKKVIQLNEISGGTFFGAARISPDKARVYIGGCDRKRNRTSISCVEIESGKEVWRTSEVPDLGLASLAISPDGRLLASSSGYSDASVRIWETESGRSVARLDGHTSWSFTLVFSNDGRRLFSAAVDQSIRIWDTSTWRETRLLRGHIDEVHGMAVSEKLNLIASGSKDGDLKLWLDDDQSASDGHTILSEQIGEYHLARLGESKLLLFPPGKPATIKDLRNGIETPLQGLGPSDEVLGVASTNIICHWNGSNRIILGGIIGDAVTTKASIPLLSTNRPTGFLAERGGFFAWAESAAPNSIFVSNLTSAGSRRELRGEMPGLTPFCFSADGKRLLGWRGDWQLSQAFAWDVVSGEIIFSGQSQLRRAAFADHGRVLVIANENGDDHGVAVYDLENRGRKPKLIGEKHKLTRIVVSKDQNLVAYATDGGQVRLLSVQGEILGNFHGYLNAVVGPAFSDDGRRLLSSYNGRESVKLWGISTRQELLNFSGQGPGLFEAYWSADGDAIVVGPQWQAWRAPSWEVIHATEAEEKTESKQP